MSASAQLAPSRWIRVAVTLGVIYALVGVLFALPRHDVHGWRLAAWLVSGAGFGVQIAYEHFRLRSVPLTTAWHVACAVALGAFGLAAVANLHSLSMPITGQERRLLRLALAIWPVVTALPAFVVALTVALGLARFFSSPQRVREAGEPRDRPDTGATI